MVEVFDGQVALITGASGGIGGAIAENLARSGAQVVLVGRDQQRLQSAAEHIGDRARIYPADLTSDDDIDALVEWIHNTFDRLDVLVHCAGAIAHESVTTAPVAGLDHLYQTNVRGPYRLTQGLLSRLQQPRGQIVFINSSVGLHASSTAGQFSMTQHAFKAYADALRDNVNASGVKVLSVFPGRTATDRVRAIVEAEGREYRPDLLLQPKDIADVVGGILALPWTAEVTEIQIRSMLKSY